MLSTKNHIKQMLRVILKHFWFSMLKVQIGQRVALVGLLDISLYGFARTVPSINDIGVRYGKKKGDRTKSHFH